MKNILFVGNANSFLIFQLAKQLLKEKPDWNIDILSDQELVLLDAPFRKVFAIDNAHPSAKRKFIKAFFVASEMKKHLHNMETQYDVVHILYVSSAYRFIWKELKKISDKIILTIFGGDYYKSTFLMKLLIAKMAKEATIISATNPATLENFSEKFKVPCEKRRLVRFGLNILDEIDSIVQEDIEKWREKTNIPSSCIAIACGYNGSTNQNLLEVIKSLVASKEKLHQKVVLCFQLTEKNSHVQSIIDAIHESGFDFLIFRERMTDRELALYRSAMNIMIQVQSTDSFSGAMQEHLYAGSLVITGNWLPYSVLDDEHVEYIKVSEIEEIGEEVSNNLKKTVDLNKNKRAIAKFSKWNLTLQTWINLYGLS